MTFQTVTTIQVTPDQLTELVRGAIRSELANYTPPAPIGAGLLTSCQTTETLRASLMPLHEWIEYTDAWLAVLLTAFEEAQYSKLNRAK